MIIKTSIQHRDRFLRTGLAHVALEPDVQVVGQVASAAEIVPVVKAERPDVALLELDAREVENHKQRLFRKLDVQNQAHAVSIAIRQGVLAPAAIARRA